MSSNQFEISIQKRKLKFVGNSCEDCRTLCQALCCRYPWDIKLTREEFQSGKYNAQVLCLLSKKTCETSDIICQYQLFRMNKKLDNSCIYLDENNLCSIHNIRPQVCRDWLCDYSFKLQPNRKGKINGEINSQEDLKLNDDDIYISYPFERLMAVIYLVNKSKLYFVKDLIQGCQRFYFEIDFNYPNLDEEKIKALIHLFDQKYNLGKIKQTFNQQLDVVLENNEFNELVDILIKHKIIINSSYFIR